MNANWFYLKSGWFRRGKRVGPITDQELLLRIDQGKIQPETLVQSSKTRNRWVPMSTVGPAMKRWSAKHAALDPAERPDQGTHTNTRPPEKAG